MKPYKVIITEKLEMEVEVEAESAAQAREIAERNWNDSEYVLDADHFKGVTFTTPRTREHER